MDGVDQPELDLDVFAVFVYRIDSAAEADTLLAVVDSAIVAVENLQNSTVVVVVVVAAADNYSCKDCRTGITNLACRVRCRVAYRTFCMHTKRK